MEETALQREDADVLVFSGALVRPVSGAEDVIPSTSQSEPSRPGSAEFAAVSKSLDKRTLGYRVLKRAFDIAFSGCVIAVGAIPCAVLSVAHFGKDAALFCSVSGGITGLWQASRRNDATFESGERQEIELSYVRDASLRLDVHCFFGTFGAMFGKNRSGR